MYVEHLNLRALIDSGAIISCLHSRIYDRLVQKHGRAYLKAKEKPKRYASLVSANSTKLDNLLDFEADIRIGGLVVPTTLTVADSLTCDLILGVDFFAANFSSY